MAKRPPESPLQAAQSSLAEFFIGSAPGSPVAEPASTVECDDERWRLEPGDSPEGEDPGVSPIGREPGDSPEGEDPGVSPAHSRVGGCVDAHFDFDSAEEREAFIQMILATVA